MSSEISISARTAVPQAQELSGERLIVIKHHALVRLTHWLNLAVLAALIASGLSIYWASPVFTHAPDPKSGSRDYVTDVSFWLGHHLPFATAGSSPRDWLYTHLGMGTFALAPALQIHWLFAYLFMLLGLLYAAGLLLGGGWRSLLPRRTDIAEAFAMIRYYIGLIPMKLLRRPWPHPDITTKYNALQRSAYLSMPVFGMLAIASGWAMHKPAQLGWLERMFGSYDGARIVHFISMLVFLSFVVPHVALVLGDGWDTMRSMITGWSDRIPSLPSGEGSPVTIAVWPSVPATRGAIVRQSSDMAAEDTTPAGVGLAPADPDAVVMDEESADQVGADMESGQDQLQTVSGDPVDETLKQKQVEPIKGEEP